MKAIFIRGLMKNILFVPLMLVSGLALAFTDEDQNTFDEKFKESIALINAKGGKSFSAKINTDPSKVNLLKGEWLVSHSTSSGQKNSIIGIRGIETGSDGDIAGYGFIHDNKYLSDYYPITCLYSPIPTLGTNYACISRQVFSTATYYLEYAFSISGNSITSGYYGVGETISDAIDALFSKSVPISGTFSLSYTQQVPQQCSSAQSDTYNNSTGVLTLPNVSANGRNYSVIMQLINSSTFSLQSAVPK